MMDKETMKQLGIVEIPQECVREFNKGISDTLMRIEQFEIDKAKELTESEIQEINKQALLIQASRY